MTAETASARFRIPNYQPSLLPRSRWLSAVKCILAFPPCSRRGRIGGMADRYDLWVYYPRPANEGREFRLCEIAARHGGELLGEWCRALPEGWPENLAPPPIWNKFIFPDFDAAVRAREEFHECGEIANTISWVGD